MCWAKHSEIAFWPAGYITNIIRKEGVPDEKSFRKLLDRFLQTGKIAYPKKSKIKTATNEENELAVLLTVTENPHCSQKDITQSTNISGRSVRRILKKHKYHAYHIQLHQELNNGDVQRRTEFCNWAIQTMEEDGTFFNRVLFSDEATFHRNGSVNRHNFHYYADENPNYFRQTYCQHRWSLNVWGGIIGEYIIGPYFFERSLNGPRFLDFLRNELPGLLENITLNIRRNMWLQLDGAPAHYSRAVRNFLNDAYQDKWIGRNGAVYWPARSPDLNKLDYFLWGYVKGIVYSEPPTTADNMRERIVSAFQSVTPAMLADVNRNFRKRIILCLEENGGHFEHLL